MNQFSKLSILLLLILYLSGCSPKDSGSIFKLLPSSSTGLDFNNRIITDSKFNVIYYIYIYNGGGTAAGDVNLDGKPDLYFAGNMVSSRLYLNNGNLRFTDVTEIASAGTDRWCTGVSMVDINHDNLLDIYICVAGVADSLNMKNMFLINQGLDQDGVPRFIDKAPEMGLDDDGYSTTGIFFDYDKDGDLDLYLLSNAMINTNRNVIRKILRNGEAKNTDRLYRNNGDGTFSNVSKEAGITIEGFGLGACAADINMDGWTDIYVSNDFISNDLLWINQQDGTFKEMSGVYMKEFTNSGMGMDIADFNNDALPDIAVLDMLPFTNERQKLMIAMSNQNVFTQSVAIGYHPQFLRNTLQLNLGKFPDGTYRFSEIGTLAGVNSTDWSWTFLLADYDNDGWKDVFISNGYRKDVTNLDYIVFGTRFNNMFGTPEALEDKYIEEMLDLPDVKVHNFIFKNNRDLTFTDCSSEWGLKHNSFSNGSIFIDLDDDGDLDLVSNNIDDEAFVYKNNLNKRYHLGENHFIRIDLKSKENPSLIYNTKIWLYANGEKQYIDYTPYRGYKSTMIQPVHFGMGEYQRADSIIVKWPDGYINRLIDVETDSLIKVNHDQAEHIDNFTSPDAPAIPPLLTEVTGQYNIKHTHIDEQYNEFKKIQTIPHKQSMYGPSIAVGDINGDGLDDFFTSGDRGQSGVIFFQKQNGKFEKDTARFDPEFEDAGSLLFDVDNDNDLDLYIVSGGSMFREGSKLYQDRLYLNNGTGLFSKSTNSLPSINSSGSCVIAADFDKDHDLDLFIGGRLVPQKYPYPARSYILENEGGKFNDITGEINEDLVTPGMISAALWTDFNNDSEMDLMICGEWMPIRLFKGNNGKLSECSNKAGLDGLNGWWNSISSCDFNNDGWTDYIVGNKGTNSFYNPSKKHPLEIYSKDFDLNGTVDPIMTHFIGETKYITHPRKLLIDQIPAMNGRFDTFSKYANASFDQSFHPEDLKDTYHAFASTFQSGILINKGGISFDFIPLPNEAQISPVFGTTSTYINEDSYEDLLITGNSSAEEPLFGYQTTFYGQILLSRDEMNWLTPKPSSSHFIVEGDARALARLVIENDAEIYIGTKNNGPIYAYQAVNKTGKVIQAKPLETWAMVEVEDGWKKVEIYYGSGYLSQNSRKFVLPINAKSVIIHDIYGNSRSVEIF
jgi:hypothetical protein